MKSENCFIYFFNSLFLKDLRLFFRCEYSGNILCIHTLKAVFLDLTSLDRYVRGVRRQLRHLKTTTLERKAMDRSQFDDVPQELKDKPRWTLWHTGKGDPRRKKSPMAVGSGWRPGSSTDSSTWGTFDEAFEWANHYIEEGRPCGGVGFTLDVAPEEGNCEDPVWGLDFDWCLGEDGSIEPWAERVYEVIKDVCYTEVSPSGNGFKAFVVGRNPLAETKDFFAKVSYDKIGKQKVEIFRWGRHFTVTGNSLFPNTYGAHCTETLNKCSSYLVSERDRMDGRKRKVSDIVRTVSVSGSGNNDYRIERFLQTLGGTHEGGRNNQILKTAGHLKVQFGLSDDEVLRKCLSHNFSTFSPPLDQHEVETTVRSALKTCHERVECTTNEEKYEVRTLEPTFNMEKFIANSNKIRKMKPADDELNADGLIKEIMLCNKDRAQDWLPELAFAGALNVMSMAMAGRVRIKDSNTVPCLFSVGLAPSGAGKDFARNLTEDILTEAGLADRLGPEGVSSAEGFVRAISDNPAILFQLDEAAELFAEAGDVNSHMRRLGKSMKEAYSRAGSAEWRPNCRADSANNLAVKAPLPSLYATTTPDRFWSSFSAESCEDGLLGRLLIFEQTTYDRTCGRLYKSAKATESIVSQVKAWHSGVGNLPPGVAISKAMDWELTDDARALLMEYDTSIRMKLGKNSLGDALFKRTQDKVYRLALIFAGSRQGPVSSGCVDAEDVRTAINLVTKLTKRVVDRVNKNLSVSKADGDRKYIADMLRKRGGKHPKSLISKITRKLDSSVRNRIIADMLDSAELEIVDVSGELHYLLCE